MGSNPIKSMHNSTTFNMSNSLSTGVPLLNGSNYALWEGPMEDYLRNKGHWAYLDMSEPDKDKQYKSWERWREAQSASIAGDVLACPAVSQH